MNTIVVIPARGGSKGIPHKNIRPFVNKSLIAHTIEQAKQSRQTERVFVSTDDSQIASISQKYGAEIIYRPDEISGDIASSESALVHALDYLEKTEKYTPDFVIFLQCTSPLRDSNDIDQAIAQLIKEEADSLISVSPCHNFLWKKTAGVAQSINYDYRHRPRRQDMNPQFEENGSIYIFKPWVLRECNNRLGGKISLFVMNKPCVDIDNLLDFQIAELIYTQSLSTVS